MSLTIALREQVRRRAQRLCEYCRLSETTSPIPHQVDHIISRQHRGADDADNLCLCCVQCNLKKGPNIASVDPKTGGVIALFNPRTQRWSAHFTLTATGVIEGRSACGRATVQLLEMNVEEKVRIRLLLLHLS